MSEFAVENSEDTAQRLMAQIRSRICELKSLNDQTQTLRNEIDKTKEFGPKTANHPETDHHLIQLQDLEQSRETIKKSIESLCKELNSVKDKLYQHMLAMEANAGRLESQSLNDSERELPLKRAAEVARTEAHRLRKLIEEINRVLDEAEQSLVVSDEKPLRPPSSSERPYFQDQYSSKLDLDYMLARFDYARRFPTSNNSYCNPSSLSYSLEPPLLGDAPSSGLEKTLSKIPDPWGGTVDIHAAPYTGELYVKDNYWGQVKVDPVNENAAILAGEARRPWSPPIEARKDYYWSGHYTTTTWYGQANFHRRNPLGAPDPSSVPETGYLGYW